MYRDLSQHAQRAEGTGEGTWWRFGRLSESISPERVGRCALCDTCDPDFVESSPNVEDAGHV
jgi:hypothetical protein